MFEKLVCAFAALSTSMAAFAAGIEAASAERETVIVCPRKASALESFAAREVRRYVYVRTGELLPIVRSAGRADAVVVASKGDRALKPLTHDRDIEALVAQLGRDDYLVRTRDTKRGQRQVYLVGGSDVATLYAAYRFAEHLGVRFYLDGDVIPDKTIPLALPDLDERRSPLFELRGIQPFHDFPEGPDWWNADEYKAVVAQLPKLGMNFFGLHTYPNIEPTVWTGLAEDVGPDGSVKVSYSTRYFSTAMDLGWGFAKRPTSDYACGAAALFDRDDYGSDVMCGLTPQPSTPEGNNEVFNRTGAMFRDVFTLARKLGVKTCVGTETPLAVPGTVSGRLEERDKPVQDLYEGIFTRIMKTHPLDYYWFWTPEGWTWEDTTEAQVQRTVDDVLAARAAAKNVGAPFELATCGWVLGPQYDRAYLGKALPNDVNVSCISRAVGHDPVEPAFAEVEGRGKWAIPWLEDDPAMTSLQLWAGRMRRDARDALAYGCTGLMGIHWRTRILGPNVATLAQAAWDQTGWPEEKRDRSGPVGGVQVNSGIRDIGGTDDDPLYQTVRYSMKAYLFSAPNGRYRVTLHFTEPYHTAKDMRVMTVTIQGKTVLDGLDVYAEVGKDHALSFTFEDVEARDGRIEVAFAGGPDAPCVAGIVVEGAGHAERINCGGGTYKDYRADPPQSPPHPPADDFYRDWALHAFGAEVGKDAARGLSDVDGRLPRPTDWVHGPGGYVPDARSWDDVQKDYAFVDAFAALRPRVVGNGNIERFDYWLNNLEFLRATGRMKCVWHTYNAAIENVKAEENEAKKRRVARETALPRRIELIRAVEAAYGYLLGTVTTSGAMGTTANLEGHTFPGMLDKPGEELAQILGEPLPADAQLRETYEGPARLVVTAKRTCLGSAEPLALKVTLLDEIPLGAAAGGAVHWRALGEDAYRVKPLQLSARNTYRAEITAAEISGRDIEYYVEVVASGGKTIRWPASAPRINQTVVIAP
ncbi:MAG TPA: hypothetical protein HPP83_06675 [Candidatus Hydrogenedentes bacterium]|nr:hypothetical protein [Candidatus Hydrogenedentota bacterium]